MLYYNEFDPKAAEWLRQLISKGLIPHGEIDERSITDIDPDDLRGFRQCHFFAGIGGWAEALRLANWPSDREVWTGSCPCQPFSVAGKGKGERDERHLWPALHRLIAHCQPPVVFGEQVASKAGRAWLSGVRLDLEALGYGVGAADLCAASVGAPHIRQRLWWLADYESPRAGIDQRRLRGVPERSGADGELRHPHGGRLEIERVEKHAGEQGQRGVQPDRSGEGRPGFWEEFDELPFRDGKTRRIEPGLKPLAHGVQGRVGLLRGYGNAIVPQVASDFIEAYLGTHERP